MAAGAAVPAAIRPPAGPAPEGKLQRPEEEKKGLKDQLAKPISIDSALAQVLEGMSLDELKLLADNKDCAEELYYCIML